MFYLRRKKKVIKVDLLEKEIDKTTVIYFESRTIDDNSLTELDKLYELLMSSLRSKVIGAGYDTSAKFFIELKNTN